MAPGVSFKALCRVHQWTVESLKGEPAGRNGNLFFGRATVFFCLFLVYGCFKRLWKLYVVYGSLLLFLLNSNTGRHVRIQFPNKKEGWITKVDARYTWFLMICSTQNSVVFGLSTILMTPVWGVYFPGDPRCFHAGNQWLDGWIGEEVPDPYQPVGTVSANT